ncbi:SLBB domain-containing protein, partial [Nitrospiraceae bacterium AH_259_D15_M11_P09]|nr:SLBB domain-containing protein [Nitrospiraceae bacterium AH_259_D15_M11_P09]
LFDAGNTAFNIELRAGDMVNVVPKPRYFIYIYGRVRNAGSFELREPISLLKAVSLAGGLAERAAANRVR